MKEENVVMTLPNPPPSYNHLMYPLETCMMKDLIIGFHHHMPPAQRIQENGEETSRRWWGHFVTSSLHVQQQQNEH